MEEIVERHGSFGCGSLEEVGQTNSPTVGPNFLFALKKGDVEARGATRFMIQDLRELGFDRVADRLEPFASVVSKNASADDKEQLWSKCAHEYTREDGPCLYRDMNWAIRNDAPEVRLWAAFIGVLLFSGNHYEEGELAVTVPSSARLKVPQHVYRGFAMEPSMLERYEEGRAFFWQAFVSTSVEEGPSISFAKGNVKGNDVAVLFEIELPHAHYQGSLFWCYGMEGVSAFPGEKEVLVMPYTRFICTKAPIKDDDGLWRVRIRAMDVPLSTVLDVVTVWIDPRGWKTGSNYDLAKFAFAGGLPRFRYDETDPDSIVPGSLSGLALFTQPVAALQFIVEELQKWEATCFRLVIHSSCSKEFLGLYFSADTVNPCEVLIIADDVSYWQRYWAQHKHIRVTHDPAVVRSYFEHIVYDFFKGDMVPFLEYGFLESQVVWYPWRRVRGGVIYGGVGAPSIYTSPPFESVRVPLPDEWASFGEQERLCRFITEGVHLVCMRPFNNSGWGAATGSEQEDSSFKELVLTRFQEWDSNSDGVISRAELDCVLRQLGVAQADIQVAFAAADADGNGELDYEEFLRWVYTSTAPEELRRDIAAPSEPPRPAPPRRAPPR